MGRLWITLLVSPGDYAAESLKSATLPIFLFFGILVGLGAQFGAGAAVSPGPVLIAAGATWAIGLAVLVVVSSLAGVELRWADGAGLLSVALLPLLLRLGVGVLLAATTSLSPFLVHFSPLLFFPAAPPWLARLDAYELWSVVLLGILLRRREGSSAPRAAAIAGAVWIAGVAMSLVWAKLS